MGEPHVVTLRATRAADLDELFRIRTDHEANRMAAFVAQDPSDRTAFDAHWQRLLADPGKVLRTVRADGRIVGDLGVWRDGELQFLGYWIDRPEWGRGIATRAVRLLLDTLAERPLRSHVAADNAASRAVLEKLGFAEIARERGWANARAAEIEELVYELG